MFLGIAGIFGGQKLSLNTLIPQRYKLVRAYSEVGKRRLKASSRHRSPVTDKADPEASEWTKKVCIIGKP